MRRHTVRALRIAVTLASVVGFAAAGHFGGNLLFQNLYRGKLRQLNDLVMRRAELDVDFAFRALSDLVEGGAVGCSDAALAQMRRQVYVRSTVKDIRVLDGAGTTLCAAFPETQTFDLGVAEISRASPARNTRLHVLSLSQRGSSALALIWQVRSDQSVMAVLNTDALLFDVVPPELQGRSALSLSLPTGDIVARAQPEDGIAAASPTDRFQITSDRYPLTSALAVDPAAVAMWHEDMQTYLLAGALVLGLAFGVFAARLIGPRNPLLGEIDEGIARGEFRPYFQPLFAMTDGSIVGCEVLVRWVKRNGEVISPYRFICLAEETGRIVPLTHNLVRIALRDLTPPAAGRQDNVGCVQHLSRTLPRARFCR